MYQLYLFLYSILKNDSTNCSALCSAQCSRYLLPIRLLWPKFLSAVVMMVSFLSGNRFFDISNSRTCLIYWWRFVKALDTLIGSVPNIFHYTFAQCDFLQTLRFGKIAPYTISGTAIVSGQI